MLEGEYLHRLHHGRIVAIAKVLEAAGYGELPARHLAYDIIEAQTRAELAVMSQDIHERREARR